MPITLFLCGDVMTGRGIDQVMPRPSHPQLYEPWVDDATTYVALAEQRSGPIPRGVSPSYVWGDALAELERAKPDARIVNLETSVTRSDEAWPGKGINYRMSPDHVSCLVAAGIDCCTLANNHVLDWGHAGLRETLDTLARAGVKTTGAGNDLAAAREPAIVGLPSGRRVLVFGMGSETSGIPPEWGATTSRPGVNLLPDLGDDTADAIGRRIAALARPGDVVVASIHWGTNWGYEVSEEQSRFAHRLVRAGVHVVHGHSSHHPRPIEVLDGRLILYGCGDFLNDYEGISGHESYRGELTLLYLVSVEPETGELVDLTLVPFEMHKFRLRRATPEGARWLGDRLRPICIGLGLRPPDDRGVLRADLPSRTDDPPTATSSSHATPPSTIACRLCGAPLTHVHGEEVCVTHGCPMFGVAQAACCEGETMENLPIPTSEIARIVPSPRVGPRH